MRYVVQLDEAGWNSVEAPGLSAEFAFSDELIDPEYTSAYRAKFTRIGPGGRSDTHVDAHNHAFCVISGEGAVRIEDQLLTMRTGSVVTVPRGLPHSLQNTGPDDLVFIAIFDTPGQAAEAGSSTQVAED
jgi:mannose-6-phosphate isomerase-like protein (cupin superfamily)